MFLNHEEIKAQNIIGDFSESEFADGSYNLTIDEIVDMNSKTSDSFVLKPQGMVYVIFKEKLNIPSGIIGFAHVKTTLTKRGIMATNIGIIDPRYNGYISTLLINFGKNDCFLCKGDAGLRVTFAKIIVPTTGKHLAFNNLDLAEYRKATKRNIANLDEKFLNLNAVQNAITRSVIKMLLGFGIIFTAASFLIGAIFQFKNSQEKDLERAIKKYETELSVMSSQNELLQAKLNDYDYKFKVFNDSLKAQSIKIEKIKK